ncbi:hypothetical protein [Microvirga sesbaniae]|uniref:hypothetical protein n=1 Tax=Microvirga sesbaniae TaxID=681392 RepID=UPI0021C6A6B0|nr:hypothetical protein [Microvirga sp. HBU67692]
MDLKSAGPGFGFLVVLGVLGMAGEAQAPRPPNRTDTVQEYYAGRKEAAQAALEAHPGYQAIVASQAKYDAAERARRYAVRREGGELFRPDPYRQIDCLHYPALAEGRYSPEFERAMRDKFFPALTNGERAAWQWDRFKRWVTDRMGRPGYVCDIGPRSGIKHGADDILWMEQEAQRRAWEQRGRERRRIRYGEKVE